MLNSTPTKLIEPGQPIPEGWQPLVNLQMPDGRSSTARAEAVSMPPRTPAEIEASIRANMARGLPVLRARAPLKQQPMILCCYGPSFRDTWRSAVAEKGDLWAVSGAHRFLLDKGVEPQFFTDVDPRPDKVCFLDAPPGVRTKYYLPSRCHPSFFDKVAGRDVTMYHVKCKQEKDVIWSVDPGVFVVPSAITSGLTAVQLGLVLGYRKFLIYGMDGSTLTSGVESKHAGEHPNKTEAYDSIVEIEGRMFATNMLMLLAVEDFFAIASEWEVGTFEFRGDGMLPWIERTARRQHTLTEAPGGG